MPMIELTVPKNALTKTKQNKLMKNLTDILLNWEGAPIDSAFAQSVSWGFVTEQEASMFYAAGAPIKQDHWRVEITVPQGALNEEKKQGLVKDVHEQFERVTGDKNLGVRLWCIITDIPSGNWGVNNEIITITEIARKVWKSERLKNA